YAEHLRVLRALLHGDAVDYAAQGPKRPIKMLIREKKYMSLEPQIPLYVSGFGPRAMELAGEYGDGVVIAIPPRGIEPAAALGHGRAGAARAGRTLDPEFHACALTNIVLLDTGEPADSERVIRTVGPNVMASVYYFYDAVQERGIEPPPFLRRIWSRYCALVESTPAAHRHFRTHEGHYTYLHPGEAELIDAEMVRATCLVGEADELIERIRELERGGLRELMFATGVDEKWRFSQEFARRVMERYWAGRRSWDSLGARKSGAGRSGRWPAMGASRPGRTHRSRRSTHADSPRHRRRRGAVLRRGPARSRGPRRRTGQRG